MRYAFWPVVGRMSPPAGAIASLHAFAMASLLVACAESPFVDTYAWDKDQLLIMYSSDRPQQVFYREAGAPGWTATASSTLEAPPPVAGIWQWNFSDWAVTDLGEGGAAIVTEHCDQVEIPIHTLAKRLFVGPCVAPLGACCSEEKVVGQPNSPGCMIPKSYPSAQTALCLFAH